MKDSSDLLDLIGRRIFRIEEEKRKEDQNKFEELMKVVSPNMVTRLHECLSNNVLLDWQIDMFQGIEDFYRTPASKFHSSKLQDKSKELEKRFRKLAEFTERNFTPEAMNPTVCHIDFKSQNWVDHTETMRMLSKLSYEFGKAHFAFFEIGKEKKLSILEWLVISMAFLGLISLLLSLLVR